MFKIKELKEKLDLSNMYDSIIEFPEQINIAFSIMDKWIPNRSYSDINNILILGMGGSAISGDAARTLSQNECKIPIYVNRSYNIPAWVNEKTLIIASSYSGNTEETLSAFNQCLDLNTFIIVITTGGSLQDLAIENSLDYINLPTGMQPRAAFVVSLSVILVALNKLKFIGNYIVKELKQSYYDLVESSNKLSNYITKNSAVELANEIHEMCPVIYGSQNLTWVAALRFKGQLQENAKMLAFHNTIPEQNHNEVEGWGCNPEILASKCIIWLKDKDDHPQILKRMDITAELLSKYAGKQFTISKTGSTRLIRLLKLIQYLDWVSYYSALLNNIDPSPVKKITELKQKLTSQ